jgi:beta-lactamase regulating signal transducer with metallopeptidase domain
MISLQVLIEIIGKGTLLLTTGWLLHAVLCRSHPRWRVVVWRVTLVALFAMPLVASMQLPQWNIMILVFPVHNSTSVIPAGAPAPRFAPRQEEPVATAEPHNIYPATPIVHAANAHWTWAHGLLGVWMAGALLGIFRLMRCQWQLARLSRAASPANTHLQKMAQTIATQLGYHRALWLRISPVTNSPFAAGVFRPMICLPPSFSEHLAPAEITALFAHEIAHLRQHDMAWNHVWRWCQALFWLHPLAWKIPAAHAFACEQEADRLAAMQFKNTADYPPLLARLTLRVLRQPVAELPLTMNGSAQITRRLAELAKGSHGPWTRWQSLASAGITGVLGLLIIGVGFSPASQAQSTYAFTHSRTNHPMRVANNAQSNSSQEEFSKQLWKLTGLHDPAQGTATDIVLKVSSDSVPLSKTCQFSGTVRYADGTPAPNVKVAIHPGAYQNSCHFAETQTDATGHFQINTTRRRDDFWWGSQTLENIFSAQDWGKQLCAATSIPWDEQHVDLVLQEPITLTGSCINPQNKPITEGEVEVWYYGTMQETNSPPSFLGKTDANGQFSIPNLPQGVQYLLYIKAKGYGTTVAISDKNNLNGATITMLPYKLYPKNHRAAGTVLDPDGRPVRNVQVLASASNDNATASTFTDRHGQFRFDAICEGKLSLFVNYNRTNLGYVYSYSARAESTSNTTNIVLKTIQYTPQPTEYHSEHPMDQALGPGMGIFQN